MPLLMLSGGRLRMFYASQPAIPHVQNDGINLATRTILSSIAITMLVSTTQWPTPLLLLPAALALALFVWLLTLHPAASGRVYAAYGGVYICNALLWLRVNDGVKLSLYDWLGAAVAFCGILIIVTGWGRA